MEPLRITAHMAGPVAYTPAEGLSLDGPLLYYVLLAERGGVMFGDAPPPAVVAAEAAEPHPGMPLAVERVGDLWCYQVSWGELEGAQGTERHHVHKRFDEAMAQSAIESGGLDLGRKAKVQTNSGEFRTYRIPRWSELAERIVWYAVGDRQEVARLLSTHVTHLGKQWQAGYGVVAEWEVDLWSGSPRRWLWRDQEEGVPARSIPCGWLPGQGGGGRILSVRPPHWLPEHQVECVSPPASRHRAGSPTDSR